MNMTNDKEKLPYNLETVRRRYAEDRQESIKTFVDSPT